MSDIHDHNLIMNEIITSQLLNELKSSFKTYLTIFNKKTRSNDTLLTFEELLINLKNKESKMTQDDKMINYVKNKNQRFWSLNLEDSERKSNDLKTENSEDKNFGSNSCYRCDESDHNANECKHKKAKCHNCDKIKHLRDSCGSSEKKKSEENEKSDDSKDKSRIVSEMKTINFISKISQISINSFFIQIIEDLKIMNHSFSNKDLFLSHILIDNQIILETESNQRINAKKRETVCILLKNENEKNRINFDRCFAYFKIEL